MENLPFAVEELRRAGYNRDHLLALLEETDRLIQNADIYQTPAGIDALGTLRLDDIELPVLEKSVQNAERKQRNNWENVAIWLIQQNRPAALCVFHDDVGRFRLALVTLRYQGILQPQAEDYRRLSLLVKPGRPNKTFVQRLPLILGAATLDQLREAFSVDAVSRHFYEEYLEVFQEDLLNGVRPGNTPVEQKQNFALSFTARVLFVSFVAKKGWLGDQEERFLPWLFQRYTQAQQALHSETEFYDRWLRPLFFKAFRNSPQVKQALNLFADLPDDVRGIYQEAPYLNGELFRRQQDLDGLSLTDEAVQKFFDFLYSYNFLVEENTNYDADLELSPELLGLLLEQLINSVGVGREVGEVGAHYTPRTEVELMCRLALVEALAAHNVLTREEAAHFVFEGRFEGNREQARRVWETLENLKVLDPAVGSGAFLVGMLQVLEELFDRLRQPLGQLLDLVELRKKILSQVLHGVDVLRWAVWMTELRLWLTLLVDLHDNLRESEEPILPSLGLRILQGDTLVQRLGDRLIPARLPAGDPFWQHPQVRQYLHNLNQARQDYFDNQIGIEEVRRREQELFDHLIEVQRQIIQQQNLQQGEIFGNENAGPVNDVDVRLEELEAMRDALREGRRPFVWWIDFSDVMIDRGGFDIVIGNPPYVRHELICDLLGGLPVEQYKDLLRRSYLMDWRDVAAPGQPPRPAGRADLFVYFYARTLRLLNDRGVQVFIVSNAWMDVAYGRWLQEIFLRYAPLRLVISNRVRRSFIADVNTVITVALAPQRKSHNENIRFCTLYKPFEALTSQEIINVIMINHNILQNNCRVVVQSRQQLLQKGMQQGHFTGDKWGGKYLRAPNIYFNILDRNANLLIQLGDIADVRFGIKSGANDFFHLRPQEISVLEVAQLRTQDPLAPVAVQNGRGWQGEIEAAWLRPLIKTPQQLPLLQVSLENLNTLIFMPPEANPIIEDYPLAHAYIIWGEEQNIPQNPAVAAHPVWWNVGIRPISQALCMMSYNDRFPFWINGVALCDARLYDIYISQKSPAIVVALLNSTFTALQINILGRTNLGQGALDFKVYEARELLIPDPNVLEETLRDQLEAALLELAQQPYSSIFVELGFEICQQPGCNHPEHPYEYVRPGDLNLDRIAEQAPARFALDALIFDLLELDEETRLAVYRETLNLVKERLVLAHNHNLNH